MTRIASLIIVGLSLISVPRAEDFTGKWSGSFIMTQPDGTPSDGRIFMSLTHKALELTGSAGPNEQQQWPLKGSVDGNKVTFDLQSDEAGVIKFTLTFVDGHLKGDAAAEVQGQKLAAKVDAERVKAGF
jgi:hypothetical protein